MQISSASCLKQERAVARYLFLTDFKNRTRFLIRLYFTSLLFTVSTDFACAFHVVSFNFNRNLTSRYFLRHTYLIMNICLTIFWSTYVVLFVDVIEVGFFFRLREYTTQLLQFINVLLLICNNTFIYTHNIHN